MRLLPHEHRERIRAYEDTQTDGEAAERLGMRRSAFRAWRDQQGLPPKARQRPWIDRGDNRLHNRRRRLLYWMGLSDALAAQVLGISRNTYAEWRWESRLPANFPKPRLISDYDYEASYRQERTDEEIAGKLGCVPEAVWLWRKRNGLPAKNGERKLQAISPPSKTHLRKWKTYCISTSFRQMSERLGIPVPSLTSWARRHDLVNPKHHKLHQSLVVKAAEEGDWIAMQSCKRRRWKVHGKIPSSGPDEDTSWMQGWTQEL